MTEQIQDHEILFARSDGRVVLFHRARRRIRPVPFWQLWQGDVMVDEEDLVPVRPCYTAHDAGDHISCHGCRKPTDIVEESRPGSNHYLCPVCMDRVLALRRR